MERDTIANVGVDLSGGAPNAGRTPSKDVAQTPYSKRFKNTRCSRELTNSVRVLLSLPEAKMLLRVQKEYDKSYGQIFRDLLAEEYMRLYTKPLHTPQLEELANLTGKLENDE